MVDFIGWQKAKELEVHVMSPSGVCLHELERDDTGLVHVRYAALRRAEDRWPPPWA